MVVCWGLLIAKLVLNRLGLESLVVLWLMVETSCWLGNCIYRLILVSLKMRAIWMMKNLSEKITTEQWSILP